MADPVAADDDCAATMRLVDREVMSGDAATIGDGTFYAWDGGIGGLGDPEIHNNDVDKGHGDGAVQQHDFYMTRIITMPVSIAPVPGESANPVSIKPTLWTRWLDMKAAWQRSFDTNLSLEHTETGAVVTYIGRPNGIVLDRSAWDAGKPLLRALISFRCGDPLEH